MKQTTEHDGVILIKKKDIHQYYVAATRAKHSIAIVIDAFPQKAEWLKREELGIGNDKIEILRYCGS